MYINSVEELYIGLTDLPIAFIALLFGILLSCKHNRGREYFYLIATASLLGSFAHAVHLNSIMYKITWFILYILLFEIVRRISDFLISNISHEANYKKTLLIAEVVLFIITNVFLFIGSPLEIYIFVTYAVFSLTCFIAAIIKYSFPKDELPLIVFCALAIICQGLKTIIPHGIIWGHVSICLALFFLYSLVKENGKKCIDNY